MITSMNKSLFFVSKPLELLGAIEAKKQLHISNAILVYSCKEGGDKKTLEFLIKKDNTWDEVIFVKSKPYYGFFWVRLLRRLQKEKFQYLFTRAFAASAYFIHNLTYEKHFLLDDGMATITISKEFQKHGNLTKRFSLFRGLNKKGVKYDFISYLYKAFDILTEKSVSNVNFFTFYSLPEIPNQTVILNKMTWLNELKKNSPNPPLKDTVFIIGTNVVGAKILEASSYLETILKIKEYYTQKTIVYIPHIREADTFCDALAKQGIIIQKNTYTIELDFLLKNTIPYHIAGTISTALITLKMIYGSSVNIDYFNLNATDLSTKNNQVVAEVYNYQNKHLNSISLNY